MRILQSNLFKTLHLPQVAILCLDLALSLIAYIAALLLRFNLEIPHEVVAKIPASIWVLLAARIMAFHLFKTYSGVIRYAGMHDVMRIAGALVFSTSIITLLYFGLQANALFFAASVMIIDFALSLLLMFSYRAMLVIFYRFMSQLKDVKKTHIVIVGAGRVALTTKRVIEADQKLNYKVVAFIDDELGNHGKLLDGARIVGSADGQFKEMAQRLEIAKAVIADQNLDPEQRQQLVDVFLDCGIAVMKVPPVSQWLKGTFNANQIRDLRIEDLLDRKPINLDSEHIKAHVADKVVLVTGAAGSIGRELAKQLAHFAPKRLILLDKAESPLHELHLMINEECGCASAVPVLADITSHERMEEVFARYRPDLVYHAAAYKHVPMLERYPHEAIKNNVLGTKVVADLAVRYRVAKFVMVSTDKAVNPTNVMGASKRIAEIYAQSLNDYLSKHSKSSTRFIVTRFGNVLGSDGSVIPRFKKQIRQGGPVTVTSPDITRYFMTIPEACQLILEAGTMGNSGEIFIFDMGQSVKIVDLARKMIRLAGFIPDVDIPIVFTGLRAGEKVEEELLNKGENVIPTYNQKIMIAKDRHNYTFDEVVALINQLKEALASRDEFQMVRQMKQMVPEFVSNNSRFEKLDELQEVKHPVA